MRVNELGVYTYGSGWSNPGKRDDVARLQFSDTGMLFATEHLRLTGTFAFQSRTPTLGDRWRNNPMSVVVPTAGGILGLIVVLSIAGWISSIQAERRAEAANKAAREAAAQANISQLVDEAQAAAGSLPIYLGEAELMLDRASAELSTGLYSPFWEALEEATASLAQFDQALTSIGDSRTRFLASTERVDFDHTEFSLGVTVLPDPASTRQRIISLYRKAQADPHFAIVYEQRRTNAILLAGFRSLGQAIESLGDRVVDSIGRLSASFDCRLADLEASLKSAATSAAEQSAALRTELQRSHDANEAFVGKLHKEAESRTARERSALRMLDNIQRRAKPTLWDRPDHG